MVAATNGVTALEHEGLGLVVRGVDAEMLEFPDGSSMRLLGEHVGTTGLMSVHRSVLRAGAVGASPHHHQVTTELIYLLAGSMQLLVGDQLVVAGQGDLAVISPGLAHAFAATSEGDAEFLDVVSPGIERFDLFRLLSRVANGVEPAGTRLEDQAQYDTYADDIPAWRAGGQLRVRTS